MSITARALRRSVTWAAGFFLLGSLMVAGVVVAANVASGHAEALRSDGLRTSGVITDASQDLVGVDYTVGGARLYAQVELDDAAPDYAPGQRVTVFADRTDPTTMTIDGQDNTRALYVDFTIGVLVAGMFLALYGVGALRQYRRISRVVNRAAFVPAYFSVSLGQPFGRRKEITVHLTVAVGSALLRYGSVPGMTPTEVSPTGPQFVASTHGPTRPGGVTLHQGCEPQNVAPSAVTVSEVSVHLHRAVLLPPSLWRFTSRLSEEGPGACWAARRGRSWVVSTTARGDELWALRSPRTEARAAAWARRNIVADGLRTDDMSTDRGAHDKP